MQFLVAFIKCRSEAVNSMFAYVENSQFVIVLITDCDNRTVSITVCVCDALFGFARCVSHDSLFDICSRQCVTLCKACFALLCLTLCSCHRILLLMFSSLWNTGYKSLAV
jgi:hypothetical protein